MGGQGPDFASYTFRASDHPDGRTAITLEPDGPILQVLGQGRPTLKLRTTIDLEVEPGQQIASAINLEHARRTAQAEWAQATRKSDAWLRIPSRRPSSPVDTIPYAGTESV